MSTDEARTTSRRRPATTSQSGRTRRVVHGLLLFFAFVIVVDALVGERGVLAMRRARGEHQALQDDIARRRAENEALADRVRRLKDDPAAIEELARRELGLIKPGERVFIIRDVSPAPGN